MTSHGIGLLRTLAFHAAQGYPPSYYEWISQAEVPRGTNIRFVEEMAERLISEGRVSVLRGRVTLPSHEEHIAIHEARRALFSEKIRKARNVARWLSWQKSVRFVALCNTTALAHAREDSDLDFFIIVKPGTIWQTRLLSVLPYKLLGKRPGEGKTNHDAVCLSFFIDEHVLSLKNLQISKGGFGQDPYLRYWALSLLPLYDDGISTKLWEENGWISEIHGLATKWKLHPDLAIRRTAFRLPPSRFAESVAKKIQIRSFPKAITKAANQGTNVVIHDRMLKLHTIDRREHFRNIYDRICREIQIEA